MRVVIVYESFFGNSARVAEAIAIGIRREQPHATVTCLPVDEAGPATVQDADLLVVGGPTHMHGMSSAISRRIALHADAKTFSARPAKGLRELIRDLPRVCWGTKAAAFDTRGEARGVSGAASGIARRLRAHGYSLVSRPTGFAVTGVDGPMAEGELARAQRWGAALLSSEGLAVSS
jgi:hypothetical protein